LAVALFPVSFCTCTLQGEGLNANRGQMYDANKGQRYNANEGQRYNVTKTAGTQHSNAAAGYRIQWT
jgi:hypothetical protein